jgi:hypothetical protein
MKGRDDVRLSYATGGGKILSVLVMSDDQKVVLHREDVVTTVADARDKLLERLGQ